MATKLINLMDIPVKVRNDHGKIKTFAPTPWTPQWRIEPFITRRATPYIDAYRSDAVKKIEIINFAPYDPLVAYIVPIEILVVACHMDRFDFFTPDFKNNPLKDDLTGQVIGITRFITLAVPDIEGFMNPPFLQAGWMPPQGPSYGNLVEDYPEPPDSSVLSISTSISASTSASLSTSTSQSLSTIDSVSLSTVLSTSLSTGLSSSLSTSFSTSLSTSISQSVSQSISISISEATPALPSIPSV